jgi:alpha/beta hydrolase fold
VSQSSVAYASHSFDVSGQSIRRDIWCVLRPKAFLTLTFVLAVEYRLLQHAPVPGALQDAAAVYAHLVTHHLGAFKGPDGKYHYPYPNSPMTSHTDVHNSSAPYPVSDTLPPSISRKDSAMPLVSSTGVGSQQHAEVTQGYVDRDGLVEPHISGNDASPHSLVNPVYSTQATTDRITAARRPRIILIGDSAGGNLVLALARWIRDEGVLPSPDGMLLLSPSCDPCMHCLMVDSKLFADGM